jgi:hypothetical protein
LKKRKRSEALTHGLLKKRGEYFSEDWLCSAKTRNQVEGGGDQQSHFSQDPGLGTPQIYYYLILKIV